MTKTEFSPIKTQRAFEVICDRIRTELSKGTLKVGDKLPAERELAQQFQVSRAALREALKALEVAGVIRNKKGARGGSFIRAAESERVVQALQDYVHLGSVSLDELTEARIFMQDVVIRHACQRATSEELSELRSIAVSAREGMSVEARYEVAQQFYSLLVRTTRNRMFGIFNQALLSVLHDFVRTSGYETLQEALIESRIRIVDLLIERDCEGAAAEMKAHLARVHEHIQESRQRAGLI